MAGMIFEVSQALSPTLLWNARLNVGSANTEFEYENPRVPQSCSFRSWPLNYMSALLLSHTKSKHALGCWVVEGGSMGFGLVFLYLSWPAEVHAFQRHKLARLQEVPNRCYQIEVFICRSILSPLL